MARDPQKLPLLITNNPDCQTQFGDKCRVLCQADWSYRQVLVAARDHLHTGYLLLSHPLAGSMKPNQTPYRSLLVGKHSLDGQEPHEGLMLLEQALATYDKFQQQRATPAWSEAILKDFRTIDVSMMQGVLEKPQIAAL